MWSVIVRQIPRINIPPIPVYIPTAAKAFGRVKIPVPIALFTIFAHEPKFLNAKKYTNYSIRIFKYTKLYINIIGNYFLRMENKFFIRDTLVRLITMIVRIVVNFRSAIIIFGISFCFCPNLYKYLKKN